MLLVTGCAGFVGSRLTKRLLEGGHKVTGIDNFSDYYPRGVKERNMQGFIDDKNFEFVEADIAKTELGAYVKGKDCVFHQAAQAGVRASWGKHFEVYTRDNILATQRLLEACKERGVRKFVLASSSSIYGDAETAVPMPVSPYGVSKLAAEKLCYLYWRGFGLPAVILRYFTVYGPGQRPDMAFHKFIKAVESGNGIKVYGDGEQTRDFTYIDDVTEANVLAMEKAAPGNVYNIGGGSKVSVNDVIRHIEKITGKKASVSFEDAQKGDVRHTSADITAARKKLGYRPRTVIEEGLRKQVGWMQESS